MPKRIHPFACLPVATPTGPGRINRQLLRGALSDAGLEGEGGGGVEAVLVKRGKEGKDGWMGDGKVRWG